MFSIVIPVKNGEKTLEESLGSIFSQTMKSFEIIVVDDGSADNSCKIASKFRCKLIKLGVSKGAAYARNIGARKAKGKFLAFMDSDIILDNHALENAQRYIQQNQKNKVFFGTFKPYLRFKNILSQYKHLYLCYYYFKQGKYLHTLDTSLTFIEKKLFEKFKFNSNVKISEDTELGMRLVKSGNLITNPKEILMEHVKYYSLKGFIKTDFVRGMQFSKLLLKSIFKDRVESGKSNFFLKPFNIYFNVAIVPVIIASLILSSIFSSYALALACLGFAELFVLFNLEFWNYLKKQKGIFFLFKSIFITFTDAIIMDAGIFITFLRFVFQRGKMLK